MAPGSPFWPPPGVRCASPGAVSAGSVAVASPGDFRHGDPEEIGWGNNEAFKNGECAWFMMVDDGR